MATLNGSMARQLWPKAQRARRAAARAGASQVRAPIRIQQTLLREILPGAGFEGSSTWIGATLSVCPSR